MAVLKQSVAELKQSLSFSQEQLDTVTQECRENKETIRQLKMALAEAEPERDKLQVGRPS